MSRVGLPCPKCSSSDAYGLDERGWGHCFSCGSNVPPSKSDSPVAVSELIRDLEYKALTRRRLSEETCRKYSYGCAVYADKDCHVANYYDKRGELVAQKVRLPGKKFVWLGEPTKATLYGMHLWKPDQRKKLVVTEGEIDCLSFAQVQNLDWPVVSVKDGAPSAVKGFKDNLEWLLGFQEVIIAFDSDAPGQKAAQACAELLPPGRARIARLALKDPNEYLVQGKAADLLQAFWEAQPYRPDGLIDSDRAWEMLLEERKLEAEVGRIPFRQPILQESWGGRRMGGVYVYCAGTGTGKSTEFREDAVFVMGLGYKVGYVALEETIGQTLQSFLSILSEKIEPTEEEMQVAHEKLRGQYILYDHHSQRDVDGLLNKIRFMVVAEGCDIVYVDHLTGVIVASEEDDERRAIDRFMKSVAALAVELKVPIMLISHLSRRDKVNHEEGDQISLKDLRGSHSIPQYATGIVAIERNQQESGAEYDESFVRRLKHRWRGRLGVADKMLYSHKTGRYLPEGQMVVTGKKEENF